MDRRARAHYDEAVRYKRAGNAAKARSHFGRAVHYAKLGQRFGGSVETPATTAEAVTKLLASKVPIVTYEGDEVNTQWAPYFERRQVKEARFTMVHATNAMEAAINEHNERGQSILYCAYRFLSELSGQGRSGQLAFSESLRCILRVPGINLAITNKFTPENSYGEKETDMALSGLAADHPSMHFILDEIQKFGSLSQIAADALHAPKSNVFSILQSRISLKEGYNRLIVPVISAAP
jgi:hypothetical protein